MAKVFDTACGLVVREAPFGSRSKSDMEWSIAAVILERQERHTRPGANSGNRKLFETPSRPAISAQDRRRDAAQKREALAPMRKENQRFGGANLRN